MTHWVVTDITDSPGDWYPRRTDWDMVLVTHMQKPENDLEQQRAIDLLRDRKLTDEFKKFALAKRPYTLWTKKGECDLSAQPTVESYKNDQRLRWLDRAYNDHPAPAPSDRVYEQSWGEATYNEICVNCHGPRYDSRGRQADTLMIMTGGDTRVANFRAGMFGPDGSAHANIDRIFGELATKDVTADDWAARYMAWMGLGGTQRTIPPVIMNVVATLSVFGEKRPVNLDVRSNGANMLSIAATLCEQSLGLRPTQSATFNVGDGTLATSEPAEGDHGVGLIDVYADYEMWLSLCSFDNPPPVRVAQPRLGAWTEWKHKDIKVTYSLWGGEEDAPASWYRPQSYPAESRVGDERGELRNGVQKTNLLPWCVKPASDPNDRVIENEWVSQVRAGKPLPYCPTDWLNADSNRLTREELKTWAARGAINAGFAVYLYLDQLSRNGGAPQPAFDRCELLGKK
jgi:mono/diheme cytochrome c family protein